MRAATTLTFGGDAGFVGPVEASVGGVQATVLPFTLAIQGACVVV